MPVENSGGPGTRDGHWRENVLHRELMTGYVEAGGVPMPLSALTVGSLLDLGYIVDFSQSDPMSFALNALSGQVTSTTKIPLVEGVMPKPVVIDAATGRPR